MFWKSVENILKCTDYCCSSRQQPEAAMDNEDDFDRLAEALVPSNG